MRRWFLRGAPGVLAFLSLLVATPGALHAQRPPAATVVRVYAAFAPGSIRPGVLVTSRVSGQCFAASLADQAREDAWRCMSGNRIMDPCFQGFEGANPVLACPASPWSARVTLLRSNKEPSRVQANKPGIGSGLPWALELDDGTRCTFLTGATSAVAGMRVNYGCVGGQRSIVGDVDRTSPQWRVFVDTGRGATVESQGVRVAWY